MKQKPSKSREGHGLTRLEDIPNVGPAIAADLRRLGIRSPAELLGRDPYAMYDDLCRVTGKRHDPCLLDMFIAAVRFMEGGRRSRGGSTLRNGRRYWRHEADAEGASHLRSPTPGNVDAKSL
jgi:hypothetical protein